MTTNTLKQPTTIIIKNYTSSNATGVASFIFGVISIFFLASIFVPLAILMGIFAIISRQFAWSLIGLLCASIGFFTSPILVGVLGLTTIAASLPAQISSYQPPSQSHELENRRANFVIATNKLLQQMEAIDLRIDDVLLKLPKVDSRYHDITKKMNAYYDEVKNLAGDRNSVARDQIIVVMNQGVIATDQVNIQMQSTDNDFKNNVKPLLGTLNSMQESCPGIDPRIQNACQKLMDVGITFRMNAKTLGDSLSNIDKTYQAELAAQQAMITKAEQIR